MLKNTGDTWGVVARTFHWVFAVIIFVQLVLGKVAEEARMSPQKLDLFVWHKSIGVTILLLLTFRIVWRLINTPPETVAGIARWEHWAARVGHILLYGLMIAVPISGWWVSDTSRIPFEAFWLLPVPDLLEANRDVSQVAETVHGILTKTLLVLIVVHIVAALRHHFILGNDTLRRMLPFRY
ncbi:MAG: cytochrome b [Woeseiaceae bacterium]|nr:cytochrome b [Woeseiaceae bacterium]